MASAAKTTSILWLRRDLRVHDLPALEAATAAADQVVPVFVFDDALLAGRFRSARRTWWLLENLHALDDRLKDLGSRLWIRQGDPAEEIAALAKELAATSVHATADVTGYARRRDDRATEALAAHDAELVLHPGLAIATDITPFRSKAGKPQIVFTPFSKVWIEQPRRELIKAPKAISTPDGRKGRIPSLESLGFTEPDPGVHEAPAAGEIAAVAEAKRWVEQRLKGYGDARDTLAAATSRLSPYLRFGVLSPLLLERLVTDHGGKGSHKYRTELAWRDFYLHVQHHFPETAHTEFQARFKALKWEDDDDALNAWKAGRTGYPVVDAAMRELAATGYMHNRARMIVASFLTKDLHLDWRAGELHFMQQLLDGDVASNNGGWQWTASTGTDPSPYFQRIFNPILQQKRFDASGDYVRRWCPELAGVPDKLLPEPWKMTPAQQDDAGCRIGDDYPEPIVDHAEERRHAVARYQAVVNAGD